MKFLPPKFCTTIILLNTKSLENKFCLNPIICWTHQNVVHTNLLDVKICMTPHIFLNTKTVDPKNCWPQNKFTPNFWTRRTFINLQIFCPQICKAPKINNLTTCWLVSQTFVGQVHNNNNIEFLLRSVVQDMWWKLWMICGGTTH